MRALLPASRFVARTSAFAVDPATAQNKDEIAKVRGKVGDRAPGFTLLSDQWKTIKLSDFHGKKTAFLAVDALAFTGG